jgi:hypothetical protein
MTNSLGGNGVARVPEMLERGMNVSLGHDCFFTLDTSEYIRYAYLVHKAHRANPALLPPFQALDLVLGNAARALGLGERIGSLAAGKRADLLILRPDSDPHHPRLGGRLAAHELPRLGRRACWRTAAWWWRESRPRSRRKRAWPARRRRARWGKNRTGGAGGYQNGPPCWRESAYRGSSKL